MYLTTASKLIDILPLIFGYEVKTNLRKTADELALHIGDTPTDTPVACYFCLFQFYGWGRSKSK